jgi:hypothetical protein
VLRGLESARGSSKELRAYTELMAAEDQFAAREAWLMNISANAAVDVVRGLPVGME